MQTNPTVRRKETLDGPIIRGISPVRKLCTVERICQKAQVKFGIKD